jgi:predicted nucleotidyltransferase
MIRSALGKACGRESGGTAPPSGIGKENMSPRAEEIIRTLEENAATLRRFGVRRLCLFGSCVRGEDNESSDLDFLVTFEKKSFDAYMDLRAFLEELFGRRIDLVLSDAIKPRLKPYIVKEAIDVPGL